MYRMYGMPRAQGCAGVAMYRNVMVDNCSCIIDTSALHGGRIPLKGVPSAAGAGAALPKHR